MASTLHLPSLDNCSHGFFVTEDVQGRWLGVMCIVISAIGGGCEETGDMTSKEDEVIQPYFWPLLSKNSTLSSSSPKCFANVLASVGLPF